MKKAILFMVMLTLAVIAFAQSEAEYINELARENRCIEDETSPFTVIILLVIIFIVWLVSSSLGNKNYNR